MAISLSNNPYTNNDLSLSQISQGQSVSNERGEEISKISANKSSSELLSQNTVTGEVVAKDGDSITLKMAGDILLEAKLTGNANISVGQKLNFEVSKSSDNQISLRPLFANLSSNNAAVSAIKAAGLPINDITIAMTGRMMQEGMSVNKNSLIDMFKSVSTHQNISPETIVQVNKLGMPATDFNLTQFENYRNFEHKITNDILDIANGITDALEEGVESGNMNTGVIEQVIDVIDKDIPGVKVNDNVINLTNEIGKLVEEFKALNNQTSDQGTPSILGTQTVDSGLIEITSGSVLKTIREAVELLSENKVPKELSEQAEETVENIPEKSVDNLNEYGKNENRSTEESGNTNKNQGNNAASEKSGTDASNSVNTDSVKVIHNEKTIGIFLDKITSDIEKTELPKDILDKINEKISGLFKSDDFKSMLKNSVKNQMTLDPKDVAKEGKIEELYERIQKTANKVSNLMESIGKADSNGAKAADNLNNNVNFMSRLNEFVNYVQLPLKMAGENAHGELCVYTKKKNLNNNDGNYSALLHLEMEHLGPMDVYVTMRNHTKVNTNFYLESEELLDFIESHIEELTKRLTQKGYDTGVTVSKKDSGSTPHPITDEFTKNEEGNFEGVVSKLCFDVRA